MTEILTAIDNGDPGASEALLPLVYEKLRKLAAEAMRRILIDRARAKGALKRGGGLRRLRLDQDPLASDELSAELLDLDGALTKLAAEDPTKAELVKLRFFAGLTLEEAARMLGISPATADRYWSYGRAWLYNELSSE